MIFRSIYLTIDDYDFLKKTRYLCHYLEREILKKIRFSADFRRVCIHLSQGPPPPTLLNSSNVLCVYIQYDPEYYEGLQENGEIVEFFIEMISKGLEKCQRTHGVPLEELLQGVGTFRKGGYKNEWVHKSRYFKERKVRAALNCSVTIEKFELSLRVTRDDRLVYDRVVLTTDPDEVGFDYRFKDIKLQRGRLIVTSKVTEPLLSISMRDLKRPIANQAFHPNSASALPRAASSGED